MAEGQAIAVPRSLGDEIGVALSGFLRALIVPVLAILVAFVLGGILILLVGGDPLLAYRALLQGAFGSPKAISETLVWATPYIFAGLGVAFAFKGGLFNIGAEGQLALGALAAAWIGYALPGLVGFEIPSILHITLVIVGGALAGALWGAIPGWLKARTGAHEVINTIMMNYIALLFVGYMLNGPMKDPSPTNVVARSPEIALGARIPRLLADYRIHWGFILALVAAVVVWWILYRTTFGFEVRATGLNPAAAKYAGMKVGRLIILTMSIAGLLAGLAGVVEVAALNYRHEASFAIGYGFESITVALLGKTNPFGVILAAILIGGLHSGASQMQFMTQLPADFISIIQALILLFVAADVIIRRLFRIRAPGEKMVLTRGWGG
jgi:general nucleoside transport system permease protein